MSEKVLYSELTPQEFNERITKAPIAYLPLGTLEWHGRHLPLGTDGLISSGFFIELARKVGGIVLPMLFIGPDDVERDEGKEYYGMDSALVPRLLECRDGTLDHAVIHTVGQSEMLGASESPSRHRQDLFLLKEPAEFHIIIDRGFRKEIECPLWFCEFIPNG